MTAAGSICPGGPGGLGVFAMANVICYEITPTREVQTTKYDSARSHSTYARNNILSLRYFCPFQRNYRPTDNATYIPDSVTSETIGKYIFPRKRIPYVIHERDKCTRIRFISRFSVRKIK